MDSFESSIVLAGENFHRLMFDEAALFPAERDTGEDLVGGPLAEFSYGSGAYRFSVRPERLSLSHKSTSIVSEELCQAGKLIVESVMAHQRPHEVSAVGLNVETSLIQTGDGLTGIEFCLGLMDMERLSRITDSQRAYSLSRLLYHRGGIRYTLRIEPHFESDGANLYVNLNAHQQLTPKDDLPAKLTAAIEVRAYAAALHDRLRADFGASP